MNVGRGSEPLLLSFMKREGQGEGRLIKRVDLKLPVKAQPQFERQKKKKKGRSPRRGKREQPVCLVRLTIANMNLTEIGREKIYVKGRLPRREQCCTSSKGGKRAGGALGRAAGSEQSFTGETYLDEKKKERLSMHAR